VSKGVGESKENGENGERERRGEREKKKNAELPSCRTKKLLAVAIPDDETT
jgi:hypothetical protein